VPAKILLRVLEPEELFELQVLLLKVVQPELCSRPGLFERQRFVQGLVGRVPEYFFEQQVFEWCGLVLLRQALPVVLVVLLPVVPVLWGERLPCAPVEALGLLRVLRLVVQLEACA
jgi:hypothetical protein